MNRRMLMLGGAGALSMALLRAQEAPVQEQTDQAGAAPIGNPTTPGATTWIQALALQAATYALPIVAMYNLRDTTCFGPHAKVRPNEILRVETIASPQVAEQIGYVTPNVNVIYGFGFMDLGQQPVILSAPDSQGRYYSIEVCDMWDNAFAYVGGHATGYKGGLLALVGPGWQGRLPSGIRRIDCPTRWVELQPRVHVRGASDLSGAQQVLRAITVTGLAQYDHRAPPTAPAYHYEAPRIEPNVASSQMRFLDPLQFWDIFSAAMNENPPPQSQIHSVLPQWQYLGIELGKQWRRENVPRQILEEMKSAAAQIGPSMMPLIPVLGKTLNGWNIPPANVGMPGADYPGRAIVAVFGLTSNTPKEAIYYTSVTDGHGKPLTGANRYTVTLQEPMPCIRTVSPGFWSVTMYDARTGFTVGNSINRYALGSDDRLKRGEDGSLTLYVQREAPPAQLRSNWLPAPSGPFYLILRVYAPAAEVVAQLQTPTALDAPPPIMPVT